jgi:Zn-dependent protease
MSKKIHGAVRLFEFHGIDLHLHWTWFLLVGFLVYLNATTSQVFSNPTWHVVLILGLFLIVTLHEFGHALACRSVGGAAENIVLWPLGGIAFVRPPDRPGAVLWSIAAGPLVNVALVPVTFGLALAVGVSGVPASLGDVGTDLQTLLALLAGINVIILAFNMLPIYPLDGGQILQSILWLFLGKSKSLMIVAYIGMAGAALLFVGAITIGFLTPQDPVFLMLIALFIGWQAYNGLRMAKALAANEAMQWPPRPR